MLVGTPRSLAVQGVAGFFLLIGFIFSCLISSRFSTFVGRFVGSALCQSHRKLLPQKRNCVIPAPSIYTHPVCRIQKEQDVACTSYDVLRTLALRRIRVAPVRIFCANCAISSVYYKFRMLITCNTAGNLDSFLLSSCAYSRSCVVFALNLSSSTGMWGHVLIFFHYATSFPV